MKKSMFLIIVGFLMLTVATTVGCSDDLYMTNEAGSELTENKSFRISRFKIDRKIWNMTEEHKEIKVALVSKSDGSERSLEAQVEHKPDGYVVGLLIPKADKLPDSDYVIAASLPDGTPLGVTLSVTMRDEMVTSWQLYEYEYALKGSGTESDPYIITSSNDFNRLLFDLYCDSLSHASGKYFRQTQDFTAPAVSNTVDGRLYSGYDFAGHYDGGGYSITLMYQGAGNVEKDSNVGLFTTLKDNAQIENLTIKALMSGMANCCGTLAGESSGTVIINNVHVAGNIEGKNNVGALIGKATGKLEANKCTVSAKVTGEQNVGGIVGYVDNGSLTVNMFDNSITETTYFMVEASDSHAGGVVGYLYNGSFNLDNVSVRHTVSQEDNDLNVISARDYCGGLIGEAVINGESIINSCEVVAPIKTRDDYMGGLIGKAVLNAELQLKLTAVGAFVQGGWYVGGMFGHITTNGKLNFAGSDSPLNNRICVIDNSYCEVRGLECVGGLFGFINGDIKASSKTIISTNVIGSSSFVGGIAGKSEWCTIDCTKFLLSNTMIVQGPDAVGGIVGYASSSTVKGTAIDDFDLTKFPKSDKFKSDCGCVVRCETSGSSYIGGSSMGGIVGYAHDSYLENLCFAGTVVGTERVGGIVGHFINESRGHLKCCVGRGQSVTNNSGESTGGVAGQIEFNKCDIVNLANYATITGCDYTGGIIGKLQCKDLSASVNVEKALNQGSVTGTANVGGCVGYIERTAETEHDVYIKTCGNTASVKSTAVGNVGGIVGYANLSQVRLQGCANHGSVEGTEESKVGGIAGRLGKNGSGLTGASDNMEMAYCCNRGEISSGNIGSNVGGLLGYQEDGVWYDDVTYMTHDCYNAGEVTSDQDDDNGGIVGNVDNFAEVVRCINFGNVSYGNAVVGTHKAGTDWYHHNLYYVEGSGKGWNADSFKKDDRSKKEIYENFDFTNNWIIDTNKNDGYPYLRNCPFQFKP